MRLLHGDCREVMATLPENSVDAIVTDPPYEIGFMSKAWDGTGVAYQVALWQQAYRVLKPGGHLLAFGGSRTYHRLACAVEDAGFEIRDQLQYLYGSGFPKSHNLHGEWEGWGTALKPAHEDVVLARKPLIGTVAANVERHGTGALNIAATRIVTGQRPDAILDTWEHEKNLCASCAEDAAKTRKPTARARGVSTALSNVAPTLSARGETSHDDTCKADIGCSAGLSPAERGESLFGAGSLSIDGFGSLPTDPSPTTASSITSTATRPTTGSKTCNSCGEPITSSTTGRWPSNVILGHSPECREVGVRRVKSNGAFPKGEIRRAGVGNVPFGTDSFNPERVERADPDGYETVTAWECAPDCAVRALDAQSGTKKSSNPKGSVSWSKGNGTTGHEGWQREAHANYQPTAFEGYGDTGGASRFFYTAKASRAERNAGLGGPDGVHANMHPT